MKMEKQSGTRNDQTSGFLWIRIVLHHLSLHITNEPDLCICNSDGFCCYHLQ